MQSGTIRTAHRHGIAGAKELRADIVERHLKPESRCMLHKRGWHHRRHRVVYERDYVVCFCDFDSMHYLIRLLPVFLAKQNRVRAYIRIDALKGGSVGKMNQPKQRSTSSGLIRLFIDLKNCI